MSDNNFYEQLRAKLQRWAQTKDGQNSKWVEYLLLLPDLGYLMTALCLDPAIPAKQKAKLAMAGAYLLSPVDLLPEALIGPLGYVDDLALIAYTINQLLNHVDDSIVLKHWKGEKDLLGIIRHIIEVADEMLGTGLLSRIKSFFAS